MVCACLSVSRVCNITLLRRLVWYYDVRISVLLVFTNAVLCVMVVPVLHVRMFLCCW